MTIDIDELERMAAAATPGDWAMPDEGRPHVSLKTANGWDGLIATADAGDYARSRSEGLANAALIAASRTAIPELIARVRELEAENERLREYAHAATKAITDLTGGGSELFAGKIGDMFIADLPYCINRVRERHDMIHRQLVGEVKKRKDAEDALVEASRKPVWEVPL